MSRCNKLVSLLALSGIAAGAAGVAQAQIVKIDGSSTVYPITEAVAEEFQKARKNAMKVTVGISGTGGGFKKFCRGEIDISDASRPISKKEMAVCKEAGIQYYEMPVAFDALTVVVNPKNDFVKSLTPADLKKMWEPSATGKVMSWKDVNPAFPDVPLKLYAPGADSGTFDYFTEAINGKSKASRTDFTASEDDNVLVQGASRDKGGLAYFGFAYYVENQKKLKAIPIFNGKEAVLPSPRSVENGTYTPLSRPIFIYVNAKSLEKPEVKQFVEYYMKHGPELIREVKYVPLPAKAYTQNMEHVAKKKIGTVYGGEEAVGVKIEELMAREAKY